MARCGCDSGSCACVVQGGTGVTVTGTGAIDTPYVVSGSGGDTSGLIPAGVPFVTTTMPNSVTGSGDMTVVVFPADTAALAIALTGDAFPRWLFAADSLGGGLRIGNGTAPPLTYISSAGGSGDQFYVYAPNGVKFESDGGFIELDSDGDTQIGGRDLLVNDGDVFTGTVGEGVVMRSPDGSQHRLVVDNAGVLSTVPWP
jgi:hypothetical protein